MSGHLERYPLKVERVEVVQEPFDPSKYLHELELSEEVQYLLMKGWRWEFVECGGGTNTISAQMLDERTDEELLGVKGIGKQRLEEIRRAVAAPTALTPF